MPRDRSAEDDAAIRQGEAELRSWDRRRRLVVEAVLLAYAAGYAFLVLGGGDAPAALSWVLLLIFALVRAAAWRWGDRGARTDGARTDFALRHRRLAGWAQSGMVRARAEQRLRRARLRRIGWGLVVAVCTTITVVALLGDPPAVGLAVFGAALVAGAVVQLWLGERNLAEARRWVADPPA
ncbi:hypothetical protein [Modestobacter roseus]|uniref:Uncharacterized protein n=1 Tax=Modestobacter roseus TaxID=1181884 RepID=A0A562INC9_9ACTN|nr:hypothetical protein [Modestobacter roseus]MQA34206.1 hypothetical protein [Modestobacter roseus]TWH72527.1 hypothetical protein JD78_01043 [Modestobacter roseus]